jgi:hypothetical protein
MRKDKENFLKKKREEAGVHPRIIVEEACTRSVVQVSE